MMYFKKIVLFLSVALLTCQTKQAYAEKSYSYVDQTVSKYFSHQNITFQEEFDKRWQTFFNENSHIPAEVLAREVKRNITQPEKMGFNVPNRPFLWGMSSSHYQVEGGIGEESSWHRFALANNLCLPGDTIGFWENYPEIIREMKEECSINAYRLSLSWERIQKTRDTWDIEAIATYKDILRTLRAHDIEPIVVMHHYTVPTWFEDQGGFLKARNNKYFVEFVTRMYQELYEELEFISTYNALEGYALKGYLQGTGAPGTKDLLSIQNAAEVQKNMLNSHVQIYQNIKGLSPYRSTGLYQELKAKYPEKQIREPLIGIQKNILPLDLAHTSNSHYLAASATWATGCGIGSMLQNQSFFDFFSKGKVSLYIPFMLNIAYENMAAPYTIDWIGVNTYSNKFMYLTKDVPEANPELQTNNPNYRFYPEGIERAVKEIYEKISRPLSMRNEKLVPIIITENGIATNDDAKREKFFRRTLLVINEMLKQGYPIIGYTPWASHDNFEWGAPYGEKSYGMYHVDFLVPDKTRTLKQGAFYFVDFVREVVS